jgi:hypothetical protein
MASLCNRARIQATALLEQEAEYRVTAQLLHVVAIAQSYAIGGKGLALAIHWQKPLTAVHIPQLEVTIAESHEGVKERPPFIAANAALSF